MSVLIEALKGGFADTYALYLKTQNYHWHVKGQNFKSLHELFETQYKELAEAVDDLAERIRTLGQQVPSTFKELDNYKDIADGDSNFSAEQMVDDLYNDNLSLGRCLAALARKASQAGDEGTDAILSDRVAVHEKAAWMLQSSL